MNEESKIYIQALKACLDEPGFYEMEYDMVLLSETGYTDFFWATEIYGKPVILLGQRNEEELYKKYDNGLEVLEVEPVKIRADEAYIKINHILSTKIGLPLDDARWPKLLTAQHKEDILNRVNRTKNSVGFEQAKELSSAIMDVVAYVTFKFSCAEKKFIFQKIEVRR
jgi:hypothetical protein